MDKFMRNKSIRNARNAAILLARVKHEYCLPLASSVYEFFDITAIFPIAAPIDFRKVRYSELVVCLCEVPD